MYSHYYKVPIVIFYIIRFDTDIMDAGKMTQKLMNDIIDRTPSETNYTNLCECVYV